MVFSPRGGTGVQAWSGRPVGIVGPVVAGAAGAAFATFALRLPRVGSPFPGWVDVLTQPVGVVFLAFGLYVWVRRPEITRMGALLWTVGFTWYLGDLQWSHNRVLFTIGFWGFYLNAVLLAHVLLASPDGRLKNRLERAAVGAGYGVAVITQGLRILAEHPLEPQGWGSSTAKISAWAPIGSVLMVAVVAFVIILVVRRWHTESPAQRKARGLFWPAVTMIGVVLVCLALAAFVRAPLPVIGWLLVAYAMTLLMLGLATVANAVRMQVGHRQVSMLLGRLQARPDDNGWLRDALAEALVDPSLTLHYRRADSGDYVDFHGNPAPLPLGDIGRAITYIGESTAPLAAITHDPYLSRHSQQREKLDAVVGAAELAIRNAQLLLQVESRAHLQGIVDVEMQTRKKIGAELHDGPQHQLSAIKLMIGQRRTAASGNEREWLQRLDTLVQDSIRDLREVTQGVYPSPLRLHGLAQALDTLAEKSPIPLVIEASPGQWPEKVAETAFFIISEATGNALRHADASHITIRLSSVGTAMVVEIRDDGIGGAKLKERGGGLRGMHDRVAAYSGSLHVESQVGKGTTVRVMLPCE
ncbi:sensor histidine kinase [Frankia sp. Cj5]|uniref:sensor histidine kinase n=1 Tax=Frankia sp. Cj5 TaxID=2880978 RepID=UPI001EF43339|nr:ATP-binding protein [Frankia sp. Cj5]